MHPEVKNYLSAIGLSSTESHLYISGLELGELTAASLAKHTGIKRTTAYSALAALVQKGMSAVRIKNGVSYYTMGKPEMIEHNLDEQIHRMKDYRDQFINVLPLFAKVSRHADLAASVTSYEGVKGVKTVVEMALYCASRKWKIIAPAKNFFSDVDETYGQYVMRVRKERKIVAQSLWEQKFVTQRRFKPETIDQRGPKILPRSFEGKLEATMIIFDQSVALIGSAQSQFAIVINAKEIAHTLELFFDAIWENARPVPRRYVVNK